MKINKYLSAGQYGVSLANIIKNTPREYTNDHDIHVIIIV